MCEPATIIAGVGLGLNVVGQKKAADARSESYDAQAKAAKAQAQHAKTISIFNAKQLQNKAAQIKEQGMLDENKIRQATTELISSQRASAAASNIDVNRGTPAALQIDTARGGEVDALRIRKNYRQEVEATQEQARITLLEGDQALTAGLNRSDAYSNAADAAGDAALWGIAESAVGAVNPKWFVSDDAVDLTGY